MAPEFHTRPCFVYEQLDADECMIERPIEVIYWNGQVELLQGGTNILIQNEDIKKLFRLIMKHLPEAQEKMLKK